ncbi:MAG: hypothetical protein RIM84_00685 [Alphaproteobacteria bacterium]
MFRNALIAAGALAGGLVLAANAQAASHAGGPMIDTKNVSIDGESFVFAKVMAAKDGYLVIHAVGSDGKPVVPGSIGHTSVKAGENINVMVRIEGGASSGKDYVVMLHDETNGNNTYDFGDSSTAVDTPSMMGDKMAAEKFMVE